MFIYVNNTKQELPVEAKLTDALDALEIAYRRGIAVAVNNMVIPRDEWGTHELQPEDKLILIKATQGG